MSKKIRRDSAIRIAVWGVLFLALFLWVWLSDSHPESCVTEMVRCYR